MDEFPTRSLEFTFRTLFVNQELTLDELESNCKSSIIGHYQLIFFGKNIAGHKNSLIGSRNESDPKHNL
ncbi:hypothetical protein [Corynebacterium crudilactis]|uniref:hypothetical protein n=1 Tax=Corynebacterium crudilactis TaxID=1652495 RepID=UPI0012FE02E9|nr:hypothetical protein [Corynebacterium crudilactis]